STEDGDWGLAIVVRLERCGDGC
ncbi:hypothetical protein A2U01_0022321, partial [Trifolium medium]|nr:hypothetical protein [Trifolium medium]